MSSLRDKPGLAARRAALGLYNGVILGRKTLDQLMPEEPDLARLAPRDRAFAHAIAATTLRHWGEIEALRKILVPKPLPRSSGPASSILDLGLAQLLFLEAQPAAVIDLAVDLAKQDQQARHFAGLVNAVLRKVLRIDRPQPNPSLNLTDWLRKKLEAAYGLEETSRIAARQAEEPPLDLTLRGEMADWPERLDATPLPNGSLRLRGRRVVPDLPGYKEGAWWVQDAAASLPVKLLGDVTGLNVLDLCAAPGGKTAQLAQLGAKVTAVDNSPQRLKRLDSNMQRLRFQVAVEPGEAGNWSGPPQDVVLLDAPCSSTGTMRRHPDLMHVKTPQQVAALVAQQHLLLQQAARLTDRGGRLLYCVCSLLPEESEEQTSTFLAENADFDLEPAEPQRIGGCSHFITPRGYLRTLPSQAIGEEHGLDGFFAAVLRRR